MRGLLFSILAWFFTNQSFPSNLVLRMHDVPASSLFCAQHCDRSLFTSQAWNFHKKQGLIFYKRSRSKTRGLKLPFMSLNPCFEKNVVHDRRVVFVHYQTRSVSIPFTAERKRGPPLFCL